MSLRIVGLLAGVVFSGSCQTLQAEETPYTRYYSDVVSQATPVAGLIGKGVADGASDRYVKVDHDKDGRIVRAGLYVNHKLENFGRFGAAEIRIDYTDNQEIWTYWDAQGEPDSVWRICYRGLNFNTEGSVHKEVYTLDENNKRISLALFDENDNPTQTYYGAGRYDWEWQDEDTVIERRSGPDVSFIPVSHFFDFETTRISFDQRGIHWLLENIDQGVLKPAQYSGVAAVRFEYDEQMQEADYSFYDADDRITERGDYGPMPHGFARITNRFSESGDRFLEEQYLDAFNRLTNNSAGFARAVYDFDEDGNYTGTRFLTVDGAEVEYQRPY